MAKKRAKIEDTDFGAQPVDKDMFKRTEPETVDDPPSSPKHPRSPSKKRLAARATYDIGPELKEAIKQESVRLGVSASQLAKYILLYGWDDYVNGRIPAPPLSDSPSPAYRHNIDFSD